LWTTVAFAPLVSARCGVEAPRRRRATRASFGAHPVRADTTTHFARRRPGDRVVEVAGAVGDVAVADESCFTAQIRGDSVARATGLSESTKRRRRIAGVPDFGLGPAGTMRKKPLCLPLGERHWFAGEDARTA